MLRRGAARRVDGGGVAAEEHGAQSEPQKY
jgi:hypothetical protein